MNFMNISAIKCLEWNNSYGLADGHASSIRQGIFRFKHRI